MNENTSQQQQQDDLEQKEKKVHDHRDVQLLNLILKKFVDASAAHVDLEKKIEELKKKLKEVNALRHTLLYQAIEVENKVLGGAAGLDQKLKQQIMEEFEKTQTTGAESSTTASATASPAAPVPQDLPS